MYHNLPNYQFFFGVNYYHLNYYLMQHLKFWQYRCLAFFAITLHYYSNHIQYTKNNQVLKNTFALTPFVPMKNIAVIEYTLLKFGPYLLLFVNQLYQVKVLAAHLLIKGVHHSNCYQTFHHLLNFHIQTQHY